MRRPAAPSPQRPQQPQGLPRVIYPRNFGRVTEKDAARREAVLKCGPARACYSLDMVAFDACSSAARAVGPLDHALRHLCGPAQTARAPAKAESQGASQTLADGLLAGAMRVQGACIRCGQNTASAVCTKVEEREEINRFPSQLI